jgi:hypothetical protein
MGRPFSTHCPRGHERTEQNTCRTGGMRVCRICRSMRANTQHPPRMYLVTGSCENGHPRSLESTIFNKAGYASCRICVISSRKTSIPIYRGGVLIREIVVNFVNVKQAHGVGLDELIEIVRKQNYACAVCEDLLTDINLDHDHACCPGRKSCRKCFRGVLCKTCNSGLGSFKDDPKRLNRAVLYLERWRGRVH